MDCREKYLDLLKAQDALALANARYIDAQYFGFLSLPGGYFARGGM